MSSTEGHHLVKIELGKNAPQEANFQDGIMYIHGAPRLPTLSPAPRLPTSTLTGPLATFDLQAPVLPLQAPPEVGWMLPCPAFINFQAKSSLAPNTLFFGDPADARHIVPGPL